MFWPESREMLLWITLLKNVFINEGFSFSCCFVCVPDYEKTSKWRDSGTEKGEWRSLILIFLLTHDFVAVLLLLPILMCLYSPLCLHRPLNRRFLSQPVSCPRQAGYSSLSIQNDPLLYRGTNPSLTLCLQPWPFTSLDLPLTHVNCLLTVTS